MQMDVLSAVWRAFFQNLWLLRQQLRRLPHSMEKDIKMTHQIPAHKGYWHELLQRKVLLVKAGTLAPWRYLLCVCVCVWQRPTDFLLIIFRDDMQACPHSTGDNVNTINVHHLGMSHVHGILHIPLSVFTLLIHVFIRGSIYVCYCSHMGDTCGCMACTGAGVQS